MRNTPTREIIKFHGGCFGCTQQILHGTVFCYDCQYFDADWNKPDLNNRPPDEADLERARVIRIVREKNDS